jgi:hypothetical protein
VKNSPNWQWETVAVIATGPSLTREQCEIVRDKGWKILAVSNAYRMAPWCDVIYAGDLNWWKTYEREARETSPQAALWTCSNTAAARFNLNFVQGNNSKGLGHAIIHTNGNSGSQAINLAYLWGAKKMRLLGFDMKPGEDGAKHFFGNHPPRLVQQMLFAEWIKRLKPVAEDLAKRGVEVINCTPGSALPWFPMTDVRDL